MLLLRMISRANILKTSLLSTKIENNSKKFYKCVNQCKYLTKFNISKTQQLKSVNNNTNKAFIWTKSIVMSKNDNESSNKNTFYYISNETLESLTEKFEELGDKYASQLSDEYDVTYSSNVLTVKLGPKAGTYVINTQTPNSQIWLSSPKSGPFRYDLIDNKWIYKHTGESLHQLLSKEFSEFFKSSVDFTKCAYGGSSST